MLNHHKLNLPLNSLLVMSLVFLVVGCGDIDDESSDFFTDTYALETDSMTATEQDSDSRTEENVAADTDVADEDIVELAANEEQHTCPWQEGTSQAHKCEEQCPDGTHYGTTYSWDPNTWICTTSGANPFSPFSATQARRIAPAAGANEEQHTCPWQEGTSQAHKCEEQCPNGTHYGTTYSWDPNTWICTITNGTNPYNNSYRMRQIERRR